MIAALYVETGGCYFGLEGVDPWDAERDARRYEGPYAVVAHPPCQRWTRLGLVNYVRWGGEHNKPGNDQGCFAAALQAVNVFGGVLEHPAGSYAWELHGLARPPPRGWGASGQGWTCKVAQSAYGHRARKLTWLYYVGGLKPFDLTWSAPPGVCQVGFTDAKRGKDRNRPTLSSREAAATPVAFRDALLSLALLASLLPPKPTANATR